MVRKKRPPRPKSHRSDSKKAANNGLKASSSHSGSKLQKWKVDDMCNALVM